MLNKQFLLHLSLIEGIGPIVVKNIVENLNKNLDSPDFYHFSAADWMHYYGLHQNAAQKLVEGLADQKKLETELLLLEKHQIQITTILDESYPTLLREIYMPPTVFYHRG